MSPRRPNLKIIIKTPHGSKLLVLAGKVRKIVRPAASRPKETRISVRSVHSLIDFRCSHLMWLK